MKKWLYPFGEVEIVKDLREIPDGDFGSCEYEGTIEEDYPGAGYNVYSAVDRGQLNFYAFK